MRFTADELKALIRAELLKENEYMTEELVGAIGRSLERFYPDVSRYDIFPVAKEIEHLVLERLGTPGSPE